MPGEKTVTRGRTVAPYLPHLCQRTQGRSSPPDSRRCRRQSRTSRRCTALQNPVSAPTPIVFSRRRRRRHRRCPPLSDTFFPQDEIGSHVQAYRGRVCPALARKLADTEQAETGPIWLWRQNRGMSRGSHHPTYHSGPRARVPASRTRFPAKAVRLYRRGGRASWPGDVVFFPRLGRGNEPRPTLFPGDWGGTPSKPASPRRTLTRDQ